MSQLSLFRSVLRFDVSVLAAVSRSSWRWVGRWVALPGGSPSRAPLSYHTFATSHRKTHLKSRRSPNAGVWETFLESTETKNRKTVRAPSLTIVHKMSRTDTSIYWYTQHKKTNENIENDLWRALKPRCSGVRGSRVGMRT